MLGCCLLLLLPVLPGCVVPLLQVAGGGEAAPGRRLGTGRWALLLVLVAVVVSVCSLCSVACYLVGLVSRLLG